MQEDSEHQLILKSKRRETNCENKDLGMIMISSLGWKLNVQKRCTGKFSKFFLQQQIREWNSAPL